VQFPCALAWLPAPRLVARSAAGIVATGPVIGLVAAAALGQAISTFLFGVEPFDPLTYIAAVAVIVVTAAIASSAPAMRAARVDPAVTFRSE
jgi:ABC-type antimicrobial peptide transport system permease subunit